jgi:CBS domain containing-hemolysin-like protein
LIMEWLADAVTWLDLGWMANPTAWLGLATLVLLEIVLGIDNLVFIAILAEKLPPHQRDRARIIGLSLALVLRLGLLASISWMVTLTNPLFLVGAHPVSGRDLIFLIGGAFLLFKATMELHERLEVPEHHNQTARNYASFGAVIAQIVVLDAVFSIDSVVTAVGMVDHLSVMVIAVVIAVVIMMAASKPLTTFVNAHPTVIVLCLGFLMMIGFSLIADGVGFHVPKGYLYAAIGFSIFVEGFNQFSRARRTKAYSKFSMRERTAEAVLRMMGGRSDAAEINKDAADLVGHGGNSLPMFEHSEKEMIRGVLELTEKSVRSVMTPRVDVTWIDLNDPVTDILRELREVPHSRIIVARDGKIDEPVGIIQKKDVLDMVLARASEDAVPAVVGLEDIEGVMRQPLYVPETMSVLEILDNFKQSSAQIALVVDEFGTFEGIVTQTDVLEAIAGDMPEDYPEVPAEIRPQGEDRYLVDGRTDIDDLQELLGLELQDHGEYHTAAGIALGAFRRVPSPGEVVQLGHWEIRVTQMEGNRIAELEFRRLTSSDDANE